MISRALGRIGALDRDQAASAAFHCSDMAALAPPSLPVLNCPFLIFSANSIPPIVTTALSNRLNPSIGRIRCFTRRWSCSDQVIQILAGSDLHSPRKFPIFLHLPHRPMGCCIGVQGDLRRFMRVLHRSAEKVLGRIHIPLSAQKEIVRSPCLIHRPVEVDPMSADLYIRLIHPPGSADWPSITLPPLLEFRQVMLDPTQDGRMCERNASIHHHDHQVSEAQFETCVPADAKNDDLSVEMPTGEQSLDRNKSTHPAMILHS